MKYYPINEELAKNARAMWSLFEYKDGSTTAEYKAEVDEAYSYAESLPDNLKEKGLYMADRYAQRLADWYNKKSAIDMRCPSIMVAGGSNFPTRKKEKQVAALDRHYELYENIQAYREKIKNLGKPSRIIKSSDVDAIEQLEAKIAKREAAQAEMKKVNAYYRKNKTLKGYGDISDEEAARLDNDIRDSWYKVPYPSFELSNNLANIKRMKQRVDKLKSEKENAANGNNETEYEFFKVVENAEIMRLQLFFDDKPEADVRDKLKANGFRWSPKNGCWQRQLTNNARYALRYLLKELKG